MGLIARRRYELMVLTPTFVGSGERYSKLETFMLTGKLYIVDLEALFDKAQEKGVSPQEIAQGLGGRVFDDLKSDLLDKSEALELEAEVSDPRGYEFFPFLKQSGKPFIPGTSLKGVIRTALLYRWVERHVSTLRETVTWTRTLKKADDRLEEKAFALDIAGSNPRNFPNRDKLRLLRVVDPSPFKEGDTVASQVRIMFGQEGTLPLYYECLKPLVRTSFTVELVSFPGVRDGLSLDEVEEALKSYASAVIQVELPSRGDERPIWEVLKEVSELKDVLLLRLGGGTGWYSHTIGPIFKLRERELRKLFEEVKERYNLGLNPRTRRRSASFPRTYRSAYYRGKYLPMGWVAISQDPKALDELARRWQERVLGKMRTSSRAESRSAGPSRFTIGDHPAFAEIERRFRRG